MIYRGDTDLERQRSAESEFRACETLRRHRYLQSQRLGQVRHRGDTDLERRRPGDMEVWRGERRMYTRDISAEGYRYTVLPLVWQDACKSGSSMPPSSMPPPLVPCFYMLEDWGVILATFSCSVRSILSTCSFLVATEILSLPASPLAHSGENNLFWNSIFNLST